MNIRPFKLINHTESTSLCDRLQGAGAHWAKEWLCGDSSVPQVTVTELDSKSYEAQRWSVCVGANGLVIAGGVRTGDDALRRRLTGSSEQIPVNTRGPLFETLEQSAIKALLDLLLGATVKECAVMALPAEFLAPGSGYVFALCRFDEAFDLGVLLWPQTVRAWLDGKLPSTAPGRKAVASRHDALGSQTVALEVVAGEIDIVFDELRALSEGVVIKLDRRLDHPLQVRLAGDGVLCAGHLGLNGERYAVQLVTETDFYQR